MSVLNKKIENLTVGESLKFQSYSIAVLAGAYAVGFAGFVAYGKVADRLYRRKLRKQSETETD